MIHNHKGPYADLHALVPIPGLSTSSPIKILPHRLK